MADDRGTVKPHLSPSAMGMLSRCPEQYRRRYIEKEVIPPGIAMLKGTGLHAGAASNFRQKITSHADVPRQEIVDAAVAGFEAEVSKAGVWLDDEGLARGESVVVAEAKDSVASLAAFHADYVAPDYQPVLVEERFRLSLPGATHDLLGVVDLVDDSNRVVDHKTTGKRKAQQEADRSLQLTAYAAGVHALTGSPPSSLRLDVLVELKAGPQRQVLETSRDDSDYTVLANRLNAAMALVEAGVFHPADEGAWCCSPRFCGYYPTCPYVKAIKPTVVDLGATQEKADV